MSQITRMPRGLQSFLGSQNFGQNPSQFGTVVAPTLDLFPFYLSERMQWAAQAAAVVNGNGPFSATIVPAGEIYYMLGVGVSFAFTAGSSSDQMKIGVSVSNFANGTNPTLVRGLAEFPQFVGRSNSTDNVMGVNFPVPIPLPAGSLLQFHAGNSVFTGAGQASIIASYRFLRESI